MNNLAAKNVVKPIRITPVKLEELFENSDYFEDNNEKIIKDYVYFPEKRVIA